MGRIGRMCLICPLLIVSPKEQLFYSLYSPCPRAAVKKSVELAPASSPRSTATPGGTAPLTPSSAGSPPHPLRRSRLAVTKMAVRQHAIRGAERPQRNIFAPSLDSLPTRPAVTKNGRASARHPRSGATPKKHFRAFSRFLAHAPRGYRLSSASEDSEERSEFRAERPLKGQPAAIVHPPDLTHFLRHSRLAVFNPRPVHFPSFLYLQNIYIYFAHNIENRHHFCFLFLAHQSFSRCSEPFSRSPKFSQVESQFLAYLCFRRWRACFSLTYAFAGGEPVSHSHMLSQVESLFFTLWISPADEHQSHHNRQKLSSMTTSFQ